ncbi:peptidylprolyl isomerase [Paraoerskovia sediminicola]|uniref:peptidylprolyl isomerase n=1 Tax=Paraoerskovia sediminicola TaxID=1138587 RepID=A0ABN6XF95_9CELL|nr:FKBP-type peptidyl-prolyl cis-trans isomerase [Paraoerskovia sediminicola]BDZ43519.1 peptidylprolyl isomerase [Paraoerskovia sediminicola]
MRRLVLLPILLALVATLGACGIDFRDDSAEGPADTVVSVSGSADVAPAVGYEAPVVVSEPWTETVWVGTGAPLVAGGDVLLNMYAEDGRDHSVISDTYGGSPRLQRMDPADLGRRLYTALEGQRVGARVLLVGADEGSGSGSVDVAGGTAEGSAEELPAEAPDEAPDEGATGSDEARAGENPPKDSGDDVPLVVVVDVLPTSAHGDPVDPDPTAPTVEALPGAEPVVTIPDTDPPTDLTVRTLVRGPGRQVEPGNTVTVRYVGVSWSDGQVIDSNWESGSVFTTVFGLGTVVDAWEEGLLEQSVGSRVLLVAPPSVAYGGTGSALADETLVYVVDILDTRSAATDETGATASPRIPWRTERAGDRTRDPLPRRRRGPRRQGRELREPARRGRPGRAGVPV